MPPSTIKPGAEVFYWPSARAPQGPTGALAVKDAALPMKAFVAVVHGPRLLDLSVIDHDQKAHAVRFVPLLLDGDHDPHSPCGRCQLSPERAGPPPVVLNAGTPSQMVVDAGTGNPLEVQTVSASDVGDVRDVLGI